MSFDPKTPKGLKELVTPEPGFSMRGRLPPECTVGMFPEGNNKLNNPEGPVAKLMTQLGVDFSAQPSFEPKTPAFNPSTPGMAS